MLAGMFRTLALLLLMAVPAEAGVTGTPDKVPRWLEDHARGQVLSTLGAPQTARFRRILGYRLSDGGRAVCGQVNSRNLTGLPMGWKPIFVRYTTDGAGRLTMARRVVDWPADVACRHLIMGWALRTGW